jgi:purine-cytosine permease-like protein
MERERTLPGSSSPADTELRSSVRREHLGVETIPEEEQRTTPWTFFILCIGGSVALGSIVYGWIPITLGLGLQDAFTSIVVGTLVGLGPVAIPTVIGSRTGTNNSTSSGAHFGVRGRLIGSTLGLTLTLVATAVAIWTSGGVLVAVAGRLLHTPTGNGALAVSYVVLAVLSSVIAWYGYHGMVRVERWVMVIGGAIALLMLPAFAGKVDLGYKGGQYALGSFASTWLLSALAVGVGSVMFVSTILGDWTRYVSPRRYPTFSRLLPVALLAIAVGYIVPMAIGAAVTTAFADPYAPWPRSLVTAAPGWYAVLLIPMALIGGLGISTELIYSSGLDLDAIVARLTRARATIITSVACVGLILLGSLVWDASESLTAASLILLAVSAPWAAVLVVGYLRCRGEYLANDLQVWNRGLTGGAYWYTGGWSLPAVIAWAAGTTFGLLTVHTTLYTGPWADIANSIDVSFVGSFLIAAVIYPALELLFGARAAQRPSTVEDAQA